MSKKILTKLLALTMCVGIILQPVTVFADTPVEEEPPVEKISVSEVNATSDPELSTVVVENGKLSWPEFSTPESEAAMVDIVYWMYKRKDGRWDKYNLLNFEAGEYRALLRVVLKPGYSDRYKLATDLVCKYNGQECEFYGMDHPIHTSYILFYSPVYRAGDVSEIPEEPPVEKISVSEVNATSDPELSTVVVENGKLSWPKFSTPESEAAMVDIVYWMYKREDGRWDKYNLLNFEAGEYRALLRVVLKSGYSDRYKLATDLVCKYNGQECEFYGMDHPIHTSYILFYSPVYRAGDVPEIPEEPSNLKIVEEWGNLYCEDQDGNRVYGLQTVDGDLYYFGEEGDGMMKHGVNYVDGKIYYFDEDGKAPKSQFVTPYYDTYYFEADGSPHTGWLDLDGEKYYADEMGTILKGVQTIDGKSYLFDRNDNGKMVTNKMAHDWEGTQDHYYGDDGVMQTGFVAYEGNTYYFYEDGNMARGWQTIDGNTYFFDNNNGIMATGTTFIYWRDYEFDENGVLHGEI